MHHNIKLKNKNIKATSNAVSIQIKAYKDKSRKVIFSCEHSIELVLSMNSSN